MHNILQSESQLLSLCCSTSAAKPQHVGVMSPNLEQVLSLFYFNINIQKSQMNMILSQQQGVRGVRW